MVYFLLDVSSNWFSMLLFPHDNNNDLFKNIKNTKYDNKITILKTYQPQTIFAFKFKAQAKKLKWFYQGPFPV